jgi:nitrogenase subunit NifH
MTTLLTLFFLFLGCGEKSDDTSTTASGYECPTVQEDSCMTEELYQECLDVVESCESGNIVVAESCPYPSFGCME